MQIFEQLESENVIEKKIMSCAMKKKDYRSEKKNENST
jgi:hypothetical protein